MDSPPRTIRRDTRVFISAVTRELGSVRELVRKGLEKNDYHPVEQRSFSLSHRKVKDKLRWRIASCDSVVHIAGHCYGAEPKYRPADAPRRSYTQLEYDMAVELGKPVYVFLTGERFPTDSYKPEAAELRKLQEAHRQHLTSTDGDYTRVDSREELDHEVRSLQLKVERLEEELQQVDRKVAVIGGRLRGWLVAVALLGIVALGTVGFVGWRQQVEHQAQKLERAKQERERAEQERERIAAEAARKEAETVEKVQQEFAERFLQQLLSNRKVPAEEARQRALSELPALVKLPLAEIESLINRRIPLQSPLDRARAALAGARYDEVREIADMQRHQIRELAMLEATAALARFRQSPSPEWNARALAAFQRAMALADPNSPKEWQDWTDAAVSAASVLHDLARYAEGEPLLRDCLRRSEANGGPDSPRVGVVLDDLARLLQATNRLSDAEPLFRRALAIAEHAYGPGHHAVAMNLNNLAGLLRATNRPSEAELLFRRALAIAEGARGLTHPDVAYDLNNLASLFMDTNRLAEAEPLFRRALEIDERSCGPDHSLVAIRLRNLVDLLQATNRLKEAEPLAARVVCIISRIQRSTGHEHPQLRDATETYRQLLSLLKIAEPEIAVRIRTETVRTDGLSPIVPEIDRRLGPASPVEDVLAALDKQYREQGKPAVWFLPIDEPIVPHLDELLGKPSR
jgi:tetratricopeptide (TPR) repeat protein